MIIDCHVHAIAATPGHGGVSDYLLRRWNIRLLRWLMGVRGRDAHTLETQAEARLLETINATSGLDAVVVLALDAVYDRDGNRDEANTHFYVANDYVAELASRNPKILFGASVHPYRKDAVAELERCVGRGAVLLKWLPVVQNFNPADERCFPFYEALAHHRLPLLCHTGGERMLPNLNTEVEDPMLLVPALERGVTVIAAHCGTRDRSTHRDYTPAFLRLTHEYERLYGDTAALNLPTRSYAYDKLLSDPVVRAKLVHGSDWPVPSIPPRRIGLWNATQMLLREGNWLQRDVEIKRRLGLDDAYWHRAATVLGLPK
jgi:predicted TIM-barrel fold metal-dependent hydrolase